MLISREKVQAHTTPRTSLENTVLSEKPVPEDVRWQDFVYVEYWGQTNPGRGDSLWGAGVRAGRGTLPMTCVGALVG